MLTSIGRTVALPLGNGEGGDRSTDITCRPAFAVVDGGVDVDVEPFTLSSVVDAVRPDMLRTI